MVLPQPVDERLHGKRERVGEQDHGGVRRRGIFDRRRPAREQAAVGRAGMLDRERRDRRPRKPAEPDRDRGPGLLLEAACDHPLDGAADEAARGDRLPHGLHRRSGRPPVDVREEDDADVGLPADHRRGRGRRLPHGPIDLGGLREAHAARRRRHIDPGVVRGERHLRSRSRRTTRSVRGPAFHRGACCRAARPAPSPSRRHGRRRAPRRRR